MGMIGMGNECYLYVNGISVSKPIWLHDTVCISPAKSAIKWKEVMPLFENDIDFSIAVLCNPMGQGSASAAAGRDANAGGASQPVSAGA